MFRMAYLTKCCFTERHVLLEVKFYLRVGIIGGHVLLFEMSYWCTCLQEGISYRMFCCTGGHILYEDRFSWRVCPIGYHVLHEGMSYRLTCLAVVLHVI